MIRTVTECMRAAFDVITNPTTATIKLFLAVILCQFSALSFLSIAIPDHVTALPVIRAIMFTAEYWWGVLSLAGALTLLFERHLTQWVAGLTLGYSAALISFGVLVFDFMFHRPPIFAGGVFAATSAVFLGGMLYDHFRQQ